jgi:hypothetical protein
MGLNVTNKDMGHAHEQAPSLNVKTKKAQKDLGV